jgi:MFS family permease
MTIPSALSMLVHVFSEEAEQARALSIFGGFAAMGNGTLIRTHIFRLGSFPSEVLGLVIGAILVQYTSWRWLFWFVAIAAYVMTVAVAILAPSQAATDLAESDKPKASKLRRLDIPGVSVLTAALILLIFAVTSGTTSGWGSATVLAPLIISVAVFAAFFFYESRLPKEHAAM